MYTRRFNFFRKQRMTMVISNLPSSKRERRATSTFDAAEKTRSEAALDAWSETTMLMSFFMVSETPGPSSKALVRAVASTRAAFREPEAGPDLIFFFFFWRGTIFFSHGGLGL